MKLKKALLTSVVMVCMCAYLCTCALAVDLEDSRFSGKTWEEVMSDFLASHETAADQVTAGYYNTVTGEEHYLNPDTLMYGASIAKLPTNMLYAARVSSGEMTMDTLIRGNRYENLQYLSLVNSDNPAMETMVRDLGGGNYAEFRKAILPYIGLTEEDVNEDFLARNFFSSRQIMYALQLLYNNAETYPGVESCMKKASPYDFFKQNRPPYTIAHKYGWYTDRGITYINDSAIVYTDEPILLVMFTANVKEARQVLADYCSLMCDYVQYHRVLRYHNEVYERTDLSLAQELEFISADKYQSVPSGYPTWQYSVVGAGCALLIIALLVFVWSKKATLVLVLLSLITIVIGGGPTELAFLAVRENTAEEVIANFEKAFSTNTRGLEYLYEADSAMAEFESTDMQSIVTNHIIDSFDIKIGEAERAGNYVAVPVSVQKVDLEKLNSDLQSLWKPELDTLLEAAEPKALYNENGEFVPDYMEQAHQAAFDALMENWDSYLYTETATLHLTITLDNLKPTWKILVNEDLIRIVNYT